ncbi:MAG: AAA family ATPase, partial [Pseudomonadota bacterium]
MAKVVLFAQQKGGAGKTTLLTQIACHLAGQGQAVTL